MMSKAKWFAVRKPSTGEIIGTSANQIVLHYIHQTPFPLTVLKQEKPVCSKNVHHFSVMSYSCTESLH